MFNDDADVWFDVNVDFFPFQHVTFTFTDITHKHTQPQWKKQN